MSLHPLVSAGHAGRSCTDTEETAERWPLLQPAFPATRALVDAAEPVAALFVSPLVRFGLGRLVRDVVEPWTPPGPPLQGEGPLRRLLDDPSAQVADVAALILHLLDPSVAALFDDHPELRRPLGWSRSPLRPVLVALATGDDGAAERSARDLADQLREATGQRPDGTGYRGDDPALVGWLVLVELACLLAAHRRFGSRPLGEEEALAALAAAAPLGELLGCGRLPRTPDALGAAVEGRQARLGLTAQGRRLIDELVRAAPRPELEWLGDATRTAAAWEVLPPWARAMVALQPPWLLRAGLGRPAGGLAAEIARLCQPRRA